MSPERKILLPAALWALALLAVFGALDWPAPPAWLSPLAALALLAAGLVGLLAVVALALERHLRRPLAALARAGPAAPSAVGFGAVEAALRALQQAVARQQAELKQLGERCARAEEALRLGEERFALVLRGAHDGTWERDLDNGRLTLSPRWKGMLGYADEGFPDSLEAWRAHVHPQDLAMVEAALDAHLQGAEPRFERQYRVRHQDGRYRWLLSRGSAVRHANGRAYRVLGLDTDISAVKRVEHVLEQVVEGTAARYGEDFFRALVRHFAAALEVPCAFITECADQPPSRVRTLAFWSGNGFVDNIEYELTGTPCETVIHEGRTCFHPRDVARRFSVEAGFEGYLGIPIFGREGEVLGHLAFLDDKPMSDEILVDSVFRIFAARAAAEFERKAIMARVAPRFA